MDAVDDRVLHRGEVVDSVVKNKKSHFKNQQRGDPDLSIEDKRAIAENLFDKSPLGFLSRFGHLLSQKQLQYFHTFKYLDDKERDEVNYYLSHLETSCSKSSKTKTKNRRYDALQKMIKSGSYFSMNEMQERNPLLYEQLVGKYQSDEEKQPIEDVTPIEGELPWMQHFAEQVEKERMARLKEQQKLDEAGDEDDSSNDAEKQIPRTEGDFTDLWGEYRGKFQEENNPQRTKKNSPKKKEEKLKFQNVSDEEKAFYLQEFQNAMYHSFLTGNDKDFDYSSVDNNSEYDCVDMRERDEQDQYFDEESPDSISLTEVGMAENSQDEFAEFCQVPAPCEEASHMPAPNLSVIPQDVMEIAIDKEEEDVSDISGRLKEEDVSTKSSFESTWVDNDISGESEIEQQRTANLFKSHEYDPKDTYKVSHVAIKKKHKIKINLKSTEM